MNNLLHLHDSGLLKDLNYDKIKHTRDQIRHEIETRGWNEELQTYTAIYGGKEVDSSLLLIPKFEFAPADSPRMQSTYTRIREKLSAGPGLLYRYRDDLSPGEGAFGICCFWAAEFLALGGGSLEEAQEEFRRVLHYANDLGLYGEEIDPATGDILGNFPQGFTHIGLINTALTMVDRQTRESKSEKAA
jgi:GH15 family glucan-1,4-alpha-glucosidase